MTPSGSPSTVTVTAGTDTQPLKPHPHSAGRWGSAQVLDYFHNSPVNIEACVSTCVKVGSAGYEGWRVWRAEGAGIVRAG